MELRVCRRILSLVAGVHAADAGSRLSVWIRPTGARPSVTERARRTASLPPPCAFPPRHIYWPISTFHSRRHTHTPESSSSTLPPSRPQGTLAAPFQQPLPSKRAPSHCCIHATRHCTSSYSRALLYTQRPFPLYYRCRCCHRHHGQTQNRNTTHYGASLSLPARPSCPCLRLSIPYYSVCPRLCTDSMTPTARAQPVGDVPKGKSVSVPSPISSAHDATAIFAPTSSLWLGIVLCLHHSLLSSTYHLPPPSSALLPTTIVVHDALSLVLAVTVIPVPAAAVIPIPIMFTSHSARTGSSRRRTSSACSAPSTSPSSSLVSPHSPPTVPFVECRVLTIRFLFLSCAISVSTRQRPYPSYPLSLPRHLHRHYHLPPSSVNVIAVCVSRRTPRAPREALPVLLDRRAGHGPAPSPRTSLLSPLYARF